MPVSISLKNYFYTAPGCINGLWLWQCRNHIRQVPTALVSLQMSKVISKMMRMIAGGIYTVTEGKYLLHRNGLCALMCICVHVCVYMCVCVHVHVCACVYCVWSLNAHKSYVFYIYDLHMIIFSKSNYFLRKKRLKAQTTQFLACLSNWYFSSPIGHTKWP